PASPASRPLRSPVLHPSAATPARPAPAPTAPAPTAAWAESASVWGLVLSLPFRLGFSLGPAHTPRHGLGLAITDWSGGWSRYRRARRQVADPAFPGQSPGRRAPRKIGRTPGRGRRDDRRPGPRDQEPPLHHRAQRPTAGRGRG